MYYCATDRQQKDVVIETSVCADIISDWFEFLRDIIAKHMPESFETIGGLDENNNPIIVEIDKLQFSKRKNNRGRIGNPACVSDKVERETRKCFAVIAENLSRSVLMPIICNKIATGSHIITDQ